MSAPRLLGAGALVALAAGAHAAGAAPLAAQQRPISTTAAAAALADSGVVNAVERARARGLPVEPLLNTVREGALRRVPTARLNAAVAATTGRLEAARAALAPSPTPPEIAAGAEALKHGASPDALRKVRSAGPDQLLVVPLGVLAHLVTIGVPVDRAAALVVELVGKRARPEQLVALSSSIESDLKEGRTVNAALDLRMGGVRAALQGPGGVLTNTDVRTTAPGAASQPPRKP